MEFTHGGRKRKSYLKQSIKEEIEVLASRIIVLGLRDESRYSNQMARLYGAIQVAEAIFIKALEELSYEFNHKMSDV